MKKTETGASLNREQKRLIDEFIIDQCFGVYIEHQIIELVERCIYADREVINQNNE